MGSNDRKHLIENVWLLLAIDDPDTIRSGLDFWFALISITLNPLVFNAIEPVQAWLRARSKLTRAMERLRQQGIPAVSGDASDPAVLIPAHVARARMLVIAIPDTLRAKKIIETARTRMFYEPNRHTREANELEEAVRVGFIIQLQSLGGLCDTPNTIVLIASAGCALPCSGPTTVSSPRPA